MPILTNQASRFLGGGSRIPADPVPVAGTELLTNGNMETGDPPASWTYSGGTWVANADTPDSSAQSVLATPTATDARARQLFSLNGWYVGSAQAKRLTSTVSQIFVQLNGGSYAEPLRSVSATAVWSVLVATGYAPSGSYNFFLTAISYGGTALFDNASFKPLTLASLISTRAYASADCDLSAAITRTAGTQAGFAARVDSTTSPANFIVAYLDGAGNVKVDKCVAGTYTNVISGAVTYGSTKVLRLVCSGNNVSAYYDGTQVGSTVTVSDAGIVSNVNHGKFSTYASNAFANYVAA